MVITKLTEAFAITHGGINDVRAHSKGKRHIGIAKAIASEKYRKRCNIIASGCNVVARFRPRLWAARGSASVEDDRKKIL